MGTYYTTAYFTPSELPIGEGYYLTRVILSNSTQNTPCDTLSVGLTRDFHLYVNTFNLTSSPISVFSNISTQSVNVSTALTVYSRSYGTFNTGNTFKFELSDSLGSFTSPLILQNGVSTIGTNNFILPTNITSGSHYRIRVVSTSPVLIGTPTAEFRIINPCPSFLDIANPIISSQTIKAKNYINLHSSISQGTNIDVGANSYILLSPGFSMTAGNNTSFKTSLVGCN